MTTKTIYIYRAYTQDGKKITRYRLEQNSSYGELIGTCMRLIADPGKVLTDGVNVTNCIDTETPEVWSEIDEPTPEPEPEGEETNE